MCLFFVPRTPWLSVYQSLYEFPLIWETSTPVTTSSPLSLVVIKTRNWKGGDVVLNCRLPFLWNLLQFVWCFERWICGLTLLPVMYICQPSSPSQLISRLVSSLLRLLSAQRPCYWFIWRSFWYPPDFDFFHVQTVTFSSFSFFCLMLIIPGVGGYAFWNGFLWFHHHLPSSFCSFLPCFLFGRRIIRVAFRGLSWFLLVPCFFLTIGLGSVVGMGLVIDYCIHGLPFFPFVLRFWWVSVLGYNPLSVSLALSLLLFSWFW